MTSQSVTTKFLKHWAEIPQPDDTVKNLLAECKEGEATPEGETRQRYMILDWQVRTAIPAWIEAAALHEDAKVLRDLRTISEATPAERIQPITRDLRGLGRKLSQKASEADRLNDLKRSMRTLQAVHSALYLSGEAGARMMAALPYMTPAASELWHSATDLAPNAARIAALGRVQQTGEEDPFDEVLEALTPTAMEVRTTAVRLVERLTTG